MADLADVLTNGANTVHPTAVIDGDVELGTGNVIGAYAVITGPCRIGDNNQIGPHAVIGTPAEGQGFRELAAAGVRIGDRCVIREFVTIHQGTWRETVVGDGAYLMARSHVPHDAVLDADVTIADNVQIAGHAWIGQKANLGLSAAVHQWTRVGAFAMVAMHATVTVDVPPGALVAGSPARIVQANRIGLQRVGADPAAIRALDRVYSHMRRTGADLSARPELDGLLEAAFGEYEAHAAHQHR